MAFQSAKVARCSTSAAGYSLVELMVASFLGVLSLAAISTVFIASQRMASQQAKQQLLVENLVAVLGYIRDDLRRAGYNQQEGVALKPVSTDVAVLGAADDSASNAIVSTDLLGSGIIAPTLATEAVVLVLDDGQRVSYAYRHKQQFTQGVIWADFSEKKLKMCRRTLALLETVEGCLTFFSMFDHQLVHLTDFSVSIHRFSAEAQPAMSISISVAHADGSAQLTASFSVRQRN